MLRYPMADSFHLFAATLRPFKTIYEMTADLLDDR